MKKLYGFLLSTTVLLTGLTAYLTGRPPALAAALIFLGLGANLHYERRVIKEASKPSEKTACILMPPALEASLITAVIYTTGFETIGVVYLGLVLVLSEILGKSKELNGTNTSKLLGRITRVLVLISGLALSQLNEFILFYAILFSAITIFYDLTIVISEALTSSSI